MCISNSDLSLIQIAITLYFVNYFPKVRGLKLATSHTQTDGIHSAKADFCCYVLHTPTPKNMCYNDLLNQIATSALLGVTSLTGHRAKTM